jgi:hypothetical protein
MENWINFGQGPLFRFSFILMLLGFTRLFYLAFVYWGKSPHPIFLSVWTRQGLWTFLKVELIKIGHQWRERPLYSFSTTAFHCALIVLPLFLSAHVSLWKKGIGFSWWSLSQKSADILTVLFFVTVTIIVIHKLAELMRGTKRALFNIGRLLFIAFPFITGYISTSGTLQPSTYQLLMLMHIYSGCLLMILLPFTSIAECILKPIAGFFAVLGSTFYQSIGGIR